LKKHLILKIEEYDKVLSQVTPEFRCTIDNNNIKFHKPNDVIGEPENMGNSHSNNTTI
jgi:hypothetical protein